MKKRVYIRIGVGILLWLFAGFAFEVFQGRRVLSDLIYLMEEPALLATDYMSNVSIGAAIINSALCGLLCLILMYCMKIEVQSIHIAAILTVIGHALFGKNLLNMESILAGCFICVRVFRVSFRKYLHSAFFSTGIAPVASFFAFEGFLDKGPLSFITGHILGILCGFAVMYLSLHLPVLHNGYTLLNGGLACGIAATVLYGIMQLFGAVNVVHAATPLSGDNYFFAPVLLCIFASLFIYGTIRNEGLRGLLDMQFRKGKAVHFLDEYGVGLTFMNMGLVGILTTLYIVLIGAELNGLTIGAILTSVGFACYGQTAMADLPIMLGTLWGAYLMEYLLPGYTGVYNSTALAAGAVFATGLAPLSSSHGPFTGFFMGIIHAYLVTKTAALQGYMSLYNNGFSIGILAVLFFQTEKIISKLKAHKKGLS